MTKRVLILCFTFLFLLLNAGIPVYAHYCGKKVTSTDFQEQKKCCCNKPEEKPMKDCCKDEAKLVKVEDNFLKIHHEFKAPLLSVHFAISFVITSLGILTDANEQSVYLNTSPPDLPVARFILLQNFRI
ncbi:HYC_CC_PP family protein [Solitalea canadensis]|nr:hypothetical protein [Solitalea canadensis]